MKGTDCTEAQIQSARDFLHARQAGPIEGLAIDDERVVSVQFGQMAKLLAWYGALRFTAGRDGTGGTLEKPGPMDTRKGPMLCVTKSSEVEMTAKEKVLAVWPDVIVYGNKILWKWLWYRESDPNKVSGQFDTEDAAWIDAASRLPASKEVDPDPQDETEQKKCRHCQSPIKPIYPMNPEEGYVHIGYGDTCDFQYCINGGTFAEPVESLPLVEAKDKECQYCGVRQSLWSYSNCWHGIHEILTERTHVPFTSSDTCWCQPFEGPVHPECPMHMAEPKPTPSTPCIHQWKHREFDFCTLCGDPKPQPDSSSIPDHIVDAHEMVPDSISTEQTWLDLPSGIGYWWHHDGNPDLRPFIYHIQVSLTGIQRYFIDFPDSRWCDQVGGKWMKVTEPTIWTAAKGAE